MAHFAKIDKDNTVTDVVVISDEQEHRGNDFLANDLGFGGVWIQTSYNTQGGVHLGGGVPFRKNYAGIGYTYDSIRDAFIPPKPYPSWILNENTCHWETPIPYPDDGKKYYWDEDTVSWIEVVNVVGDTDIVILGEE